jgi:hypothetical protein
MPKYYDEDDMYDYDDYDDFEEQHDNVAYGGSSLQTSTLAPSQAPPAEPPSDYVQFVMEALGSVETNSSGSRSVGIISESRVLQMLEAYSFDVETTISYFMKQRESSKSTCSNTAEATGKKRTDSKAPLKPSTLKSTSISGATKSVVIIQDDVVSTKSKPNANGPDLPIAQGSVAAGTLITSSAPLSDDENDSVQSDKKSAGPSIPHITMVVAGHVDAGKSTLVGNRYHQLETLLIIFNVDSTIVLSLLFTDKTQATFCTKLEMLLNAQCTSLRRNLNRQGKVLLH